MHQLGEEEAARSYWGLPRLESILQDLRFGLRMLRKTPGVSLVAITVLALGIGSNIAVFSIIDTFYFRPLPVANASRLIGLYATDEQYQFHSVSYPEYAYLRDHNSTTMGLAAHYSTAPLNLVTESDSREVQGAVVSANYFSLLGLTPALGRFFLQEEDSVPDRDAVAVISSRLWRERFDRNPSILQQKIKINGVFFQVVGVMPEGFEGVLPGNANEIYIPTMMLHAGYRWCDTFQLDCTPLNMIGRLKPGVRMADAQADFQVLARQLAAAYPQTLPGRGALIVPVTGANPRSRVAMTTEVQLLIGISAVLLLIVCANVAGLLLVRGEARRKEIAIRLSIGAGRLRVVRQLLTEGLAMVILGGGAGLLASVWIKARLAAFYLFDSEGYVHRYDFSMNPRVALISAGLCLVTAMLFGLAPALAATKQDFVTGLKGESNAIGVRGSRGLRNSLVAAQIALSLMLVVATLLLVRSAGNIAHGGNLDPEHVALLRLRPRLVNYTPEKAQAYIHEVVRRLQNLAEVQAITYARGQGTVWNGGREAEISLFGHAIGASNHGLIVNYQQVSAGYFSTLKLPLLQGREFDDNDNLKMPHVAIVNQTLARRLWPQADALGQIVLVDGQACRVVGIAADIALHSASAPLEAFVYTPFWQDPTQVDVRMAIRVRNDEGSALPLLHKTISSVDPDVPITEEMPMSAQVQGVYSSVLMAKAVAVCAGSLALCLSMIGLYALLAFSVSRRTREIGIRMALGAARGDITVMVLRQALHLALVGLGLGLLLSFIASRFLAALLFGVQPVDLQAFAAGAILLLFTLFAAAYYPARRATKVDPVIALRCE